MRTGLEQIVIDGRDSVMIGQDPRKMRQSDLSDLGHVQKPLLRVIREKCIDCCGGSESEVRRCISTHCPLWPYRMASNPLREPRKISVEQKKQIADRLSEGRARSRDPAIQE